MSITIEDVKKNVAYKQLPIVILDERWHRLFPEKDKSPEVKRLEKNLGTLLKRQGQITNDLKALRKIKSDIMKEIIDKYPEVMERAKKAMEALDIVPELVPIRGGTDGSRLSFMGLPCPNIFTGGYNFHGKYEFTVISYMELACKTIIEICKC